MRILFAPMEGFTGYTYRNVHHRFYAGIAEYYTPFLAVRQTRKWKTRERKDIDPANNEGISVIPQLLTNKADDFLWAAESLVSMGYHEINLNLGCPSSTVVTKHKGAGFLDDPEELDAFFSQVFANLPPGLCVSVKTRLGIADSAEMDELLPVFNRYPLKKLIVHPRVRNDFYKGPIHLEAFRMVYENSKNPVVYNGDIVTVEDYEKLISAFPDLQEVMIGRGLIRHPDLAERILKIQDPCHETESPLQHFCRFHDSLLSAYENDLKEPNNCLPKMKDLWSLWSMDLPEHERSLKKIKKARTVEEYESAVKSLTGNLPADTFS